MPVKNKTVSDRVRTTNIDVSPTQLLVFLGFTAALGFTLLFMQEPLLHDSLHDFRHSIGMTCH